MANLKWLLLAVFATVVVGTTNIRPDRESKKISHPTNVDYFAKFKDEVRRGCRPRPGSNWCTGKREYQEDAKAQNPYDLPNEIALSDKFLET